MVTYAHYSPTPKSECEPGFCGAQELVKISDVEAAGSGYTEEAAVEGGDGEVVVSVDVVGLDVQPVVLEAERVETEEL